MVAVSEDTNKIPHLLDILEAEPGFYRPHPDISKAAERSVLRRDMWCCRFCGQNAGKFNHVLAVGGNDRDLDVVLSGCVYCWQCFDPKGFSTRKSAELVHCPEFQQQQINRLGLQVKALMRGTGMPREMAEKLKGVFRDRAQRVAERLSDAKVLQQPVETILVKLRRLKAEDPEFFAGLRIWPADRWIRNENGAQLDQHPLMLAYWRSAQSGIGKINNVLNDQEGIFFSAIRFFVPELAEACQKIDDSDKGEGRSHADLAAKLLRDAATFLENLGLQNASITRQMGFNATIFRKTADLVEEQPNSHANNDVNEPTHATLAAMLLRDAANILEKLAIQNRSLRDMIMDSSDVYRHLADLVEKNAEGIML